VLALPVGVTAADGADVCVDPLFSAKTWKV
jgi:hypothetical protein